MIPATNTETRDNSLQEQLQSLRDVFKGKSNRGDILAKVTDMLPVVGEKSAEMGFLALLDICLLFKECLQAIRDPDSSLDEDDYLLLTGWPDIVQAYIESPEVESVKAALIEHLCHPAWGKVIDADTAELLKNMLDMPVLDASVSSSRQVTELEIDSDATPDDEINVEVSENLPVHIRELLELLIAELLSHRESILKSTSWVMGDNPDPDAIQDSFKGLEKQLGRFADAAETIGFQGLSQIAKHVVTNIHLLSEKVPDIHAGECEILKQWSLYGLAYLRDPGDTSATLNLISLLQDTVWPQSLSHDESEGIQKLLASPDMGELEEDVPKRQSKATADDVSLQLDDDVSQDLLEGLLQELPGQSEEFSAAIQRLINGGTLEDVNIAKRIAHTLKGAGNTVGVRGIATLTHNLEDILLALTKHNTLPTPPISKTLMNAADCLAVMSESLLGMGEAPDDAREVLQEVLDLANLIDRDGINATAGKNIESTNTDTNTSDMRSVVDGQSQPSEPARDLDDKEGPVPVMRVPADFVDNLLRLVGESIIMTEQIRERIRLTLEEVRSMQSEYDLLYQLGGELEQIIDIKDLSKLHQQQTKDSKFDPLEMDQYSELHTCSRRLVEASVDATELGQLIFNNLNRLGEMLINQAQLNNEIQEGVMRTRKVPAKSQFPRLQRCVRQASRLINKDVEIHLDGGETLMDSDTLNSLLDPLMHLLRNAVDHGIENTNDRIAAGKEPKGNIYLEFLGDGNNVLVRCRDDGRGLNYEEIRRTAIDKGMLNKEQVVSEEELKHLILLPSFSTRSNTTQVSGRGIGMDAAYAKVMELSGFFQLNSESGQGCTIEIQLPQTLISSYALLAYVGPRLIAIANRGIEQIYYHDDGQLLDLGTEVAFQLGDSTYPVKPIESLLNIAIDRRSEGRTPRTIILVQTETGKTAVTVEKVVRSNDLVIKNLGHYIPKIPGILGITILGNGNVTPVLDLAELIRQSGSVKGMKTEYRRSDDDHRRLPTALVVDDSLSARRSLVQFMQDAGYKVRSARDGLEAIEILNVLNPDIVLSDLEMPRMNGMEFVNHVRASDDKSSLPIIIITSRTASKHQQEAIAAGADVYLTKPYSEDELLEQIQKLQKSHD